MFFNSSRLQNTPTSLSVCQTDICFSDSVRNLGFYFDNNLTMKGTHQRHLYNRIEIHHISCIRHYLSAEATKTLNTSLVLSRLDYCNFLFLCHTCLNFRESRDSAARPVVRAPSSAPTSHRFSASSTGCQSNLASLTKLPVFALYN